MVTVVVSVVVVVVVVELGWPRVVLGVDGVRMRRVVEETVLGREGGVVSALAAGK